MTHLPDNPGGVPSRRTGGLPERGAPKKLSYVPATKIGFDCAPEEIVLELTAKRVILGSEVAATAYPPVTKRRSDGTHYQMATAWWSSTSRYVTLELKRDLVPAGDGRFRPAALWRATGKVFHLPDGLEVTTSVWRRAGEGTSSGRPKSQRTQEPLDILPPSVAQPVRGGQADAWQEYGGGAAVETVVASLLVDDRVRILRATRQSTSKSALEGAEWILQTLDAPITRAQNFSVGQ